jgi:predicted TIM-barrel fold metal-dependent hydrolase
MPAGRRFRGAPPDPPLVAWAPPAEGSRRRRIVYTGPLAGSPDLVLHHGVDGWQGPIADLPFDRRSGTGAAVVEAPDLDGHLTIDFAVRSRDRWDDNHGADYRLWTTVEPVDAHVHARDDGHGGLGAGALRAGLASAGIRRGVVSWQSNHYISRLLRRSPDLAGLVWVRPGTPLLEVRRLLAHGRVGLKLHPNVDGYDADDRWLDRHLRLAAGHGVPAAIHSAPGHGDPDRIRRLAERHPDVPVILYHTFLGPYEGRRRAVAHALRVPNLVLETSWCKVDEVRWIIDQVGAHRVIFGSDAAVDGPRHFVDRIVEDTESYNDGLLALARALPAADARAVLADTTCRLFRLPAAPQPGGPGCGSSSTSGLDAAGPISAARRRPRGTSRRCSTRRDR